MTILEQILSSPQQIHLLRFFLFHPDEDFSLEEVRTRVGKKYVGTGRPIKNLVQLGCLIEGKREGTNVSVYRVATSWLLYPEFRAVFVKAQLLVEHDLIRKLEKAGNLKLLILAGLFVGQRGAPTDVMIVGSVNARRVTRILKGFEQDLDQEVRYTILSNAEYWYRKNVGDRFLYDILENRHLVVLDTLERVRNIGKSKNPKRGTARRR